MRTTAHPYMANSVPAVKKEMLDAIGASSVDELFIQIPERHRLREPLFLPPALSSEVALHRHLRSALGRNIDCETNLSFLGAGCWQHHVPAVCDEIAARGELLTAYGASPYSDHGKFQAMFEYQSLLGELVGMDVVTAPTYDAGCAAGSALRMACRLTGRREILVAGRLGADRLSQIRGFTKPVARLVPVAEPQRPRELGRDRGKIWIADDFDAPMPDDFLAEFERPL